jgi:hypothetical protein
MTTLNLTHSILDFSLSRVIGNIGRILDSIVAAHRATNDFERMNARTDAQLAASGYQRADLGRVVFERYFS